MSSCNSTQPGRESYPRNDTDEASLRVLVTAVAVPLGVVLCIAVFLLAAMVAMLLLQRRRTQMAILEACPRNNQTVGVNNQRTRGKGSYREKSHVNAGFVSDIQQQTCGDVLDNETHKMVSDAGESKEQIYQNVTFARGQRNGQRNIDEKQQSENDKDECYDDIRCHMDISEETREQPLYDEPCVVLEVEAEREQEGNVATNDNTPDEYKEKTPIALPRKPSLKPKPKCWKRVKVAVDTAGSFKKGSNEKQVETCADDITLVENDIYATK